MARRTLMRHPKFKRLWRELKISPALARGLLEQMWDCCHDASDPVFHSWRDCEAAAEWSGQARRWVNKLIELRLLDAGEAGSLTVHDYWEHCPDYVHKRYRRRQLTEEANGGQRRTMAAKGRPDPDPEPKPQPRELKTGTGKDLEIVQIGNRRFEFVTEENLIGHEATHVAEIAAKVLNGLQMPPPAEQPKKKRMPRHIEFGSMGVEDLIAHFAQLETKGTPERNLRLWRSRINAVVSERHGRRFLDELAAHIHASMQPSQAKGVGPIDNHAAYANLETSKFLKKKKAS